MLYPAKLDATRTGHDGVFEMMEFVVFVLAAAMILGGAIGVIVRSHPVHAALSLILTLFGVAVLFVAQEAHFLAVVQVIVYAGAIVVLFLFVIMLLGVDRTEDLSVEPFKIQRPLAVIVGVGVVGLVSASVVASRNAIAERGSGILVADVTGDNDSNIRQLARSIFGDYVVAFELTSVLLVVAVVGTVLLTRRIKPKSQEAQS
jgi:NADH-quinone oxidoreductase subunit J